MLFELRAYDLKPGAGPAYLELFRKAGIQYVTRHLPMLGYWLTDSGRLNRLYHLWLYDSLQERLECRARLAADLDWTEDFVPKGFPLILAQSNRFLRLEQGSARLTQAAAARKTVHHAHRDDQPMFTPNYLSLTAGTKLTVPADVLGCWTTVSGDATGEGVTLYRHETDDPMVTARGTARHELLRALTGSPLS